MKNKDIHEWLLDEGIDPLTTVPSEKGEYYLSDILKKHLTDQLYLFAVSGELPPSQISDKEYKKLMKVLYPKDNSKRF